MFKYLLTARGDAPLPRSSQSLKEAVQVYAQSFSDFTRGILNALQRSNDWESTAVIIAYDDHQMPPIVNQFALPYPGARG